MHAGYFVYHDVRVTHGAGSFNVCWTAGTGEIGPVGFSVADQEFLLERGCTEQFGCSLKANEVVTTRVPRDPEQPDRTPPHHRNFCPE